ncbi:MAG TPA: DUF262 domain-containing protein [Trebonia sp.]|nr:DUF262 domain-containing protein [Trebonia sp.]
MAVEKTEREIGALISEIARGEIKLPEIQRGYVWKPTQVAKLLESLYRGYPTGSLLFWKTTETPLSRDFDLAGTPPHPVIQPLYLLDGQQRLTALSRALGDDDATEIVFNVESEAFQNQSAATAKDPRWVKVREASHPDADLYEIGETLQAAASGVGRNQIARSLQRLAGIRNQKYYMEILTDFPYDEIAQIFVRVNSGGRTLRTSDLALATLSARWPGVLAKLEAEAALWAGQGYDDIDVTFLTRALTGAVLGRGLSAYSHARLVTATDETLEHGWATVRRGLRSLIPLLKNNLKVSHSSLLPSMLVLLPLVVLLGERSDEPLLPETADAILYWLLVATIRNRYSSATDTTLGQDIPAARSADPERTLLANLGFVRTRLEVSPDDLVGRSVNSPYFLLSFLVAQRAEARDWWFGSTIALGGAGGQKLEYHHIHPQATLARRPEQYTKAEINDLANLAFISARANKKISDRSPRLYFAEVGNDELAKHFVPLDPYLRDASAFREFLTARRLLLASAMTSLLDLFCPSWLSETAATTADPLAGSELDFTLYRSDWDAGRIVATAKQAGRQWTAAIALPDLESVVEAASEGLASDVTVGTEILPVTVDDDGARIPIGPFLVTGTIDDWRTMLTRERAVAQPLSQCPAIDTQPWTAERLQFPVANID